IKAGHRTSEPMAPPHGGKEREMEVVKRAALALAAAMLATVGLTSAALATTPATGTGAFVPAGPPTTLSTRTADGNTSITQVQKFIDTGLLTGAVTFTFHPNVPFNI